MSCPYCHRDEAETSPVISDKLKNILTKVGKIKIFFYGGEPTLYMDVIKVKVPVPSGMTAFNKTIPFVKKRKSIK